jgi:extracellular matrix protein 14
MLYPAPGNILDWMYSREAIKYSYVAHLRDTGTVRPTSSPSSAEFDLSLTSQYGFALPEKWIRPTGEETSGLIDYLARFIAKQAKSA